jgi:hypothetical protein
MSIKKRLKRLEGEIPDGYQDTLKFLRLSWKTEHSSPPWLEPPPEVMMELETRAREMVDRGENLSLRRLLQEIDGRGQPRPVMAVVGREMEALFRE